tara:strand:- start:4093 stop:5331 length:1239 start_codon:yes stop_codon:yes gene_type:complete
MNSNLFNYSSHVIAQPQQIKPLTESSNIIIIDSKDRNKKLYSNSNDYTITFPNVFKDIVEIELISICYKYSNFKIDKTCNTIFFDNNSTIENIEVKLPDGNYTDNELSSMFTNEFSNNQLPYKITMKYSSRLDRYYFLINNSDVYTLKFKGEISNYNSNLFTDNKNVTISQNNQINTYKKYTNGSYYGFSPNNFTNMLNIDKMTISATQDNGKFNHNLLLDFSDNKSYYQMAEAFNMYDNELKLTIVAGDTIYDIDNTKLQSDSTNTIKFKIENNKIIIMVVLDVNLENIFSSNTVLNPNIYTNIVVGDIIKTDLRDQYVLLDIKEFDRLVSINDNIHNSYVKIPVDMNHHQYFDNAKVHGTIKYFDPIMPSLDRFTIRIRDRNGQILNDNGLDHTMIFSVKCLNDKKNYET